MANFYNGVSSGNAKVDEMLAKGWKPYSGNFNLGYSDPELEAQLRSQGYGDLVDANPWKNLNYNKSGWQGFLGSLGFRTGFDTSVENQQFQYKEYLSNIQNLASQNKYNSEQEKAARERAAGINVDLQGIGDASESSGLAEDTNNVLPNSDEQDVPAQVANYVMTGISTAMGLAGQIGTLKQISTSVASGKLDNIAKISDFIFGNAINYLSPQLPESDEVANDVFNSAADKMYNDYVGLIPRGLRKSYRSALNNYFSGLPVETKAYEEYYKKMAAKKSSFMAYSSDTYDDSNDVMMIISEELNKYADRAYRKRNENAADAADLEAQQIQSEGQYLDEYNPTQAASAENAANRQSAQQNNFEADLNSVMSNITHRLKDIADEGRRGSWVASAALVVFSLMRMMSVNRSSTSGYNKVLGNYNNSSMSIGF